MREAGNGHGLRQAKLANGGSGMVAKGKEGGISVTVPIIGQREAVDNRKK
jgi:hypothetical protein